MRILRTGETRRAGLIQTSLPRSASRLAAGSFGLKWWIMAVIIDVLLAVAVTAIESSLCDAGFPALCSRAATSLVRLCASVRPARIRCLARSGSWTASYRGKMRGAV